jgi:hypothetical protein
MRTDIRPLCPLHYCRMVVHAELEFACPEGSCEFRWKWNEGYFCVRNGQPEYSTHVYGLLKPEMIREHGYLFIESIVDGYRNWRCAVKNCPNTFVDLTK